MNQIIEIRGKKLLRFILMRTQMPVCNHWRRFNPNSQCDIHGVAKKGKPRDQLAFHNPGIIDMVAVCAAYSIFALNQQRLSDTSLTL